MVYSTNVILTSTDTAKGRSIKSNGKAGIVEERVCIGSDRARPMDTCTSFAYSLKFDFFLYRDLRSSR